MKGVDGRDDFDDGADAVVFRLVEKLRIHQRRFGQHRQHRAQRASIPTFIHNYSDR